MHNKTPFEGDRPGDRERQETEQSAELTLGTWMRTHEHVPGVRVGVDVAVDECHLRKCLQQQDARIARPNASLHHGGLVAELDAVDPLHGQHVLARQLRKSQTR